MLRPIFGPAVARGFQSRSGRDGADVEGTPFWVEAKHEKLVDLRAAIRQALKDTDGRTVVVVAKDDRKPPGWVVWQPGAAPLAVMRLSCWLKIVAGVHLPTTGADLGTHDLLLAAAEALGDLGHDVTATAVRSAAAAMASGNVSGGASR